MAPSLLKVECMVTQCLASTDSGLTWTERASPPAGVRSSISPRDGSRPLLQEWWKVHPSHGLGVTWTIQNDPGSTSWFESAISSDGRFQQLGSF